MKRTCGILLTFLAILVLVGPIQGGVRYEEPPGGWTYALQGDKVIVGNLDYFDSLDGEWDHNNDSDAWDGSGIGAGAPGGVSSLQDGPDRYLRLQDPGDPRGYGLEDPSNRKLYFAYNITYDGAGDDVLDTGVTLSFRARLATYWTGILDDHYPSGSTEIIPWALEGKGYPIAVHGKGMFGIRAKNGKLISFSLALPSEDPFLKGKGGLTMNGRNGTIPTDDVDFVAGELNLVELEALDRWHEFWITIVGDTSGGGTHRVTIWADGDAAHPQVRHVTASSSGETNYADKGYLALGMPSTGLYGAFDADFLAYRKGVYAPAAVPQMGQVTDPDGLTIVMEGGFTDSLNVVLSQLPAGEVSVFLDPNDQLDLGNGPGVSRELVFGPGDWDQAKSVTVSAHDDSDIEGPLISIIGSRLVSSDAAFNGKTLQPVHVNIIDNDTVGIVMQVADGIQTSEADPGEVDTYDIWLTTPPAQPVTIVINDLDDPCQVVISPSQLDFSAGQVGSKTVTVRAFNDTEVEKDPHYTVIKHTVQTMDSAYGNQTVPCVTTTIHDDECGAWGTSSFDLNGDCYTNIEDFAEFARRWLNCSHPGRAGCRKYN